MYNVYMYMKIRKMVFAVMRCEYSVYNYVLELQTHIQTSETQHGWVWMVTNSTKMTLWKYVYMCMKMDVKPVAEVQLKKITCQTMYHMNRHRIHV